MKRFRQTEALLLRLRKQTPLEWVLLAFLCAQLLSLFVLNITRLPYFMDYDSAPSLVQVRKMVEERAPVLSDWGYTTSLILDSALLPALLCSLTGNAFLAYGLTNNLIILLFLYVFVRICRDGGLSRGGTLFALILLFTPYSLGQLDYANMLFISQACYNIRVLLPLMMMSILLRLYQKPGRTLRNQWGFVLLFFLLLLVSCISTGAYPMASCVAPLALYVLIETLARDGLDRSLFTQRAFLFVCASACVAAAGYLTNRSLDFAQQVNTKSILSAEQLFPNLFNCIAGFFVLLGGLDETPVQAVSALGGVALLRMLLAVLLLAAFVFVLLRALRRSGSLTFEGMGACIVSVNLAVLLLIQTAYGQFFEYRYLLVSTVPLFLYGGKAFDLIRTGANASLRRFFTLFALLALAAVNLYMTGQALKTDNGIREIRGMYGVIESEGVGHVTVFYQSDWSCGVDARILQSVAELDTVFIVDGDRVNTWGQSLATEKHLHDTRENAVLVNRRNEPFLPPAVRDAALRTVDTGFRDYRLYVLPGDAYADWFLSLNQARP